MECPARGLAQSSDDVTELHMLVSKIKWKKVTTNIIVSYGTMKSMQRLNDSDLHWRRCKQKFTHVEDMHIL